jgi:hypothetical protein
MFLRANERELWAIFENSTQCFHFGAKRYRGDLGCSFHDVFVGVSGYGHNIGANNAHKATDSARDS